MGNSFLVQETIKNEIRSLNACMEAMDLLFRTCSVKPNVKDLTMIRDVLWDTHRRLRELEDLEQDDEK